jgi:hypothetical protein
VDAYFKQNTGNRDFRRVYFKSYSIQRFVDKEDYNAILKKWKANRIKEILNGMNVKNNSIQI